MRQLFIAILLISVTSSVSNSAYVFVDGSRLALTLAPAWQRATDGNSVQSGDFQDAASFSGYVLGVADSFNGVGFELPATAKAGQLCAIVAKYLKDNPSEWNLPGSIIVFRALELSFPKTK